MFRRTLLSFLLLPSLAFGQSITPQPGDGTFNLPTPQLLTSASGNFTVPSGVNRIRGIITGAGGGGGGVSAAAATGAAGIAGVMIEFVMVVTPGQVIAYTNGSGGSRGANTGTVGGTGGDTTFGTLTAKGGSPGAGSTSGNAAATGSAGASVIGMITGSAAVPTTSTFIISQSATNYNGNAGATGTGGVARGIWGTSAAGTNGSASDCVGYGGGGSGAGSTSNTAGTGGLGCPGAILLW